MNFLSLQSINRIIKDSTTLLSKLKNSLSEDFLAVYKQSAMIMIFMK